MLGCQVKTGDSYFAEARTVQGVDGWWFRSDKHGDYWRRQVVPHLIVLHDLNANTSFWAPITNETIVSTGKGIKIFVPRANVINADHAEAIVSFAETARRAGSWEGSAWTRLLSVPDADRLRYALIAPRVVAPHRNAGFDHPISAEQAIALVAEGRLREIDFFREKHIAIPTWENAADHAEWCWRFAAAVRERVTSGATVGLVDLVADAPGAGERAAAAAAAAAALLETARPDDAIAVLDPVLGEATDMGVVDRAWLLVQRGRAYREIGSTDLARADAVEAQQARLAPGGDLTATAIAGVATLMLFHTSDWGAGDVADVITGIDTTATWWRAERVATGASAVIDREFQRWSQDTTLRFQAEDVANNRLFSGELMASHVGDHGVWRRLAAVNARQHLVATGPRTLVDRAADLLDTLRLCGDDKGLRHAIDRVITDGPAIAIRHAAARIDFTNWTHTTAATNLIMLWRGGDVVDETTATAAVEWLLGTLADPTPFWRRATPTFFKDRLVDALAGIAPALPPSASGPVAEHLVCLPVQDELTGRSWSRVVDCLPPQTWAGDLANRCRVASVNQAPDLRYALLAAAAAAGDQPARDLLLNDIRDGSVQALGALADDYTLTGDDYAAIVNSSITTIQATVENAAAGVYPTWGYDPAALLARFNVKHPDHARWEPLLTLLASSSVSAKAKRGALSYLTVHADKLDSHIRVALADGLLTTPPLVIDAATGQAAIADLAKSLSAALDGSSDEILLALSRLSKGSVDDRCIAAEATCHLAPKSAVAYLASVVNDPEPRVRAHAAHALTLLAADPAARDAAQLLLTYLDDTGALVPRLIAEAAGTHQPPAPHLGPLLAPRLREHCSAAVRAHASGLTEG